MRKLIYVMVTLFLLGCSSDTITNDVQNLERGRGKGKKPKVALLTIPQSEPSNTTQAITNVMLDPVEYLGELPTDDNGGLVDWDSDGQVDDLIVVEQRCYFPRTFTRVYALIDGVNEQLINNSIAFGAELLGFDDVNGDGLQDIIWAGGNHYRYNSLVFGQSDEQYSPYNVGYNSIQEEPTPLADLVSQLTLAQSVNNPDYVRWDLGSQYDAYVFHVVARRFEQLNDSVPQVTQTHTYGEWGIYAPSMFQGGGLFEIEFTNLGEDCTPITINFEL